MKMQPYQCVEDFCAGFGCPRNKFSLCGSRKVSFHRFPKDKELRNKWTLSLKLSAPPTENSVLCSSHFESDCFVLETKLKDSKQTYYRSLKKDAIPSIPAIQISFIMQKMLPKSQHYEDCENEMPAKAAKLEATNTPQSSRLRNPLASGNWNSTDNLEMQANEKNCSSGRENLNVENTASEKDDDDVQVLRVFESLARKAERQKNVVFRSRPQWNSRSSSRNGVGAKMDRRPSALDKTEDLEQHQRYKALLRENSFSLNSGYKNDSPLLPAVVPYCAENSLAPQVKKSETGLAEYNYEADTPSSGIAEKIIQDAKYTTEWILNMEEKRKKSYREEMMKAEKAQEFTQLLQNHNEKLAKTIEKKQWDLRSAFEIFKIEDEARLLPTLTREMEEQVSKALHSRSLDEKLVTATKITITRRDIQTLQGANWLNDEVVNCYMDMIKQRSSSSNGRYPKVLTFNTFFFTNLSSQRNAVLKRWNRKIDLFSYDMILAPIHESVHWVLVQVDFRSKRILYLDSMGGHNLTCLKLFLGYLVFESKERNVPFNPDEWRLENAQGNPKQRNGSDCGVFACTYAEFLSRDAKFTFDQSDMPFLRRKMVYEILHGLLTV